MSEKSAKISLMSRVSYAQKVFLLATLPLLLAVAIISLIVTNQSRQLSESEIQTLESQLIEAKKEELKNYLSLAKTAFIDVYGRAAPSDPDAMLRVTQILSSMIYGQDGFFFVYDYDGVNLVSPRQTYLINKDWSGLADENGEPVVDRLIEIARSGGGYHTYDWQKPSSGETARMVTYVIGLQDWRWAVGTGVFIDDVIESVAAARAETQNRIQRTFVLIILVTIAALIAVFLTGMAFNIRERRLADAKLKQLTERIFETQEEERGRVARELHDSISQMLIGIRYTLELAQRRITGGDARASNDVETGIDSLTDAIQEVRRISSDLRPGILDDLGLGPALKSLIDEFSARSGIETNFETVVFRNRLDQDAKIALYRIAQEALTNVERHSDATKVAVDVFGHRKGATMRIQDNGKGMLDQRRTGGLGMRNMQERIDQLNGTLRILSTNDGTTIEASVPLSHMLGPKQKKSNKDSKSA